MISSIFKNKEIRTKLIITAIVLVLFRIGCAIPVPFINTDMLDALFGNDSLLDYANVLTGGALSSCALFALGITPAINASIVMQLLAVAIDKLGELQRGDKEQRDTYQKISKALGLAFSVIMGVGYYFILKGYDALEYTTGLARLISAVVICAMFICGASMCTWLSLIIDEIGIGSGMSLLIFAGIIVRLSTVPSTVSTVWSAAKSGSWLIVCAGIFIVLFVAFAILYICYMSGSERKVPVMYAKSAGATYSRPITSEIPLKLMFGGVLPVVFSVTLLSLPQTIMLFLNSEGKVYAALESWDSSNWFYMGAYVVLIFLMNLFYISTQFNAPEVAETLRTNGGTIPGVRPGKTTAEYLSSSAKALAHCGSFALCVVAVVPMIIAKVTDLDVSFGGTSLIIVCAVSLEVTKNIKSKMASYRYFEKDTVWS